MAKFQLNSEGVRSLLKSSEIEDVCMKYATNAQARLGEGYEAITIMEQTRVYAQVEATTYKAKKDNAKNNTILKAVIG